MPGTAPLRTCRRVISHPPQRERALRHAREHVRCVVCGWRRLRARARAITRGCNPCTALLAHLLGAASSTMAFMHFCLESTCGPGRALVGKDGTKLSLPARCHFEFLRIGSRLSTHASASSGSLSIVITGSTAQAQLRPACVTDRSLNSMSSHKKHADPSTCRRSCPPSGGAAWPCTGCR